MRSEIPAAVDRVHIHYILRFTQREVQSPHPILINCAPVGQSQGCVGAPVLRVKRNGPLEIWNCGSASVRTATLKQRPSLEEGVVGFLLRDLLLLLRRQLRCQRRIAF